MRRSTLIPALALTLVIALAVPALLHAQAELMFLSDAAFGEARRPAVAFRHDEHNQGAGLEDCAACHHVYTNGARATDEDSVGTPCADCHAVKAATGTPLMRAFHRQCAGCHEASGKGPVMCGECHARAAPAS